MQEMMKDKRILGGIIGGVVLIVLVVVMMLMRGGNPGAPTLSSSQDENTPVAKLQPEDIGLSIVASSDNKYVSVKVAKLDDIKRLDWEFSYDSDVPKSANLPDSDGQRITQSLEGHAIDTDFTSPTYESKPRELGHCSKNVCVFDTGVTSVNLLVKVTKSDGKLYQINDTLSL